MEGNCEKFNQLTNSEIISLLTMSQCNRSSSFMSVDCDLHHLEHVTSSQLVSLLTVLGREGCALPESAFKSDIMVSLCTTHNLVYPKYITALHDVECILEFEEGM